MQFLADVNPADQLSIDINLWVGRPVRVLLETFTDLFIFVDVKAAVLNTLRRVLIE
jgi:hypothetical protein